MGLTLSQAGLVTRTLVATNDYWIVFAHNNDEFFTFITFDNRTDVQSRNECQLNYSHFNNTKNVIGLSIGSQLNTSHFVLAYLSKNHSTKVSGHLIVAYLEKSDRMSSTCVQLNDLLLIPLHDTGERYGMVITMDSSGTRTYTVAGVMIISVDIASKTVWSTTIPAITGIWYPFYNENLAITDDYRLFLVGHSNEKFYLRIIDIIIPNNISILVNKPLSEFRSIDKTLSISIHNKAQLIAIGIPSIDLVLIFSIHFRKDLILVKEHYSHITGVYFGQSVAFISNQIYAVLVYNLSTLPWSLSQIQVYYLTNTNSTNEHSPLFIFPNNQQTMPIEKKAKQAYYIVRLLSWNEDGMILLGNSLKQDWEINMIIPSSQPGYYSAQPLTYTNHSVIYRSVPCISGTSRDTNSFGPCFLCPSNTKTNGSKTNCYPCLQNDVFCARSMVVPLYDIPFLSNFDQAIPYPESIDSTEFDDILLENMFKLTVSSFYCLVRSPLFWVSFVLTCGLIIFIIMNILKYFSKREKSRMILKKAFQQLDLIGEGQLWLGGLASLAIIVLIGFACKFSLTFNHLYPIENLDDIQRTHLSCNSNLLNAKFSSSLQLLSTLKHNNEKLIFTMLDQQLLTLTVHFISTAFTCNNVTIQQKIDRRPWKFEKNINCIFDEKTFILSVSNRLSQHRITTQFNLLGPFFVGAIQLCLQGPSDQSYDGLYYVHPMNFCQFLSTNNNTLAIDSSIQIEMTKVVNRTANINNNDNPSFTGLWLPTLTTHLVSEEDEPFHYIKLQMSLLIDITQSKFYMKNIQEPIARPYDITFNTILFSMLCLELFGLLFLISKLAIVPFVHLVQKYFFQDRRNSNRRLTKLTQLTEDYLFEKRVQAVIEKLKQSTNEINVDLEIVNINSFPTQNQ